MTLGLDTALSSSLPPSLALLMCFRLALAVLVRPRSVCVRESEEELETGYPDDSGHPQPLWVTLLLAE